MDASDSSDVPRPDSPVGPEDPGWVHPGAIPDECEIEVATYPERVFPVGPWLDECGVGCRHWGDVGNLVYVQESEGEPLMVVIGAPPVDDPDQARYVIFSELDTGRAIFAFRDRVSVPRPNGEPLCFVDDWGLGAGALAVGVSFLDYDETGDRLERSWMRVLRADLDALPDSLRSLVHRDDWSASISERLHVTESHVGLLFGFGLPVLVGNDGSFVRPTFGTSDTSTKLNLAMAEESELFWESWSGSTKVLARSSAGAAPEVIRSVEGADIRGFASDGVDFAWLEGRGWDDASRSYDSVSLWTARYDGAALVGIRQIADVQQHAEGAVGGGYYVHAEPDPDDALHPLFAFYRLSDGMRAIADPGPLAGATVVWVSDDDAIVEAYGQLYRFDPRELHYE